MGGPPRVYLDNAATTSPDPAVIEAMVACWRSGAGNAGSVHGAGVLAARLVEQARAGIAARLGARPDDLLFTSGGTEANNLALHGVARANGRDRGHLLCTAIDHPSVLEPLRRLAAGGFALDVLPVDGQGFLDPGDLARALRRDTVLVSVIHGHNELATVQPLAPLAAVCAEAGVPLHVDACQSFTRVPIDVASVPIALVTLNAHKIHGPQGVGALYVRPGTHLWPGQVGGGQERGLRAGTLNTAGIVGFAEAVAQASPERLAWLHDLRSFLAAALVDRLPGVVLHGPRDGALPHVLSAAFPGCVGQDLLLALARRGYQVSAGSACKAGSGEPSRALLAAGVEADMARATLRISPSHQTTRAEIEDLIDALVDLTRGSRGVP